MAPSFAINQCGAGHGIRLIMIPIAYITLKQQYSSKHIKLGRQKSEFYE